MIPRPIFNNVLLRQINEEQRTPSGLVLATANSKSQDAWLAEVLAIGPGEPLRLVDSIDEPVVRPVTSVAVGDRVFVPSYNGYKTSLGSANYLLVKDTDILAVVDRGE